MKITSIILSHYKERENNLKRIVDDLTGGTVVPDEIIVFIDDRKILFLDDRTTIIQSSKSFLPIIRFALGTVSDTDYCFFMDDDLSVGKKTLENFVSYAEGVPNSILGLEGSILANNDRPYTNDTPVKRREVEGLWPVDILIRTYFVPTRSLLAGLQLRIMYPDLPKTSLDDIFLCLGNKYLNECSNFVIPVDAESNLIELPEGGVGQAYDGSHYENRNKVCRFLMDKYNK